MPSRQVWIKLALVFLSSLIAADSLKAQTPDEAPTAPEVPSQDVLPPTTPPPTPKPPPQSLPPEEDLLPFPATPIQPEEAPPSTEATITVTEFRFTSNTALSDAELAQTVAGLTNQPLPLSRLLQVASDVASLYAQQGYQTSGAIVSIPETTQQQRKGVVEIQVIEGELESIEVISAAGRLNPGYVRSRLALATSKPLNIERLQSALQLLQLDPLISRVSATLSAGSRPGQSILEVEVAEADSFDFQAIANNNRSPSVGSFQRGGLLREKNLLGFGDEISLNYTNTDGSNAVDASYTVPLNARNGTIGFTYSYVNNDVIEPPFDRLNIESESSYYQLSLRQPIIQTINQQTQTFQEVALGVSASLRDSEILFSDQPFPLLGSEADGTIRIAALRFFQEWTRQNARSVLALRSEMSVGLDAFDSTTNESIVGVEAIPDSRFVTWRGQAQWVRLLAPETLLIIRGNLQLSDDTLFASEQFSIGGFYSVRGYRQDRLLTDNGFVASTEIRLPVLRVPDWQGVLQVIPFIDYGIGWNSEGIADPDPQNLAAVGLGLQWQQGDRFVARLDWGIPLVDVESRDRTWQEDGLYFSVQWNPF